MSSGDRDDRRGRARRAAREEHADAARDIGRTAREEVRRAAEEVKRVAREEVRRAAEEVRRAARDEAERAAGEARRAARQLPAELIWSRAEPGARRPRLTREQIAAAALALADAEGLEAVSMRRVATALEVGTMTLYYYVETKDELLALMNDAMMGELLVPEGELPGDWRGALAAIARRSRDAHRRHRWATEAPPGVLGPNAMRHFEQSLAAVDMLEVDFATKFELIAMVDDYVFGFSVRALQDELARLAGESEEGWAAGLVDYIEAQLATGDFPHTRAILGVDGVRATLERLAALGAEEERFDRGLERLLDGIALELEGRTRPG
jgi:AcrR family transcriptional regulator